MAVYEELETKIVRIPDGRYLMLYRSCALGDPHPAKGVFKAIIWSPVELDSYIFNHREICPDAPVVLRGKEKTCRDYGDYLERLKKRAEDWSEFAAQYPHMYAEETLGWKVHAAGRTDYSPAKWMGSGEFRSLWSLHGGQGIIATPDKRRTKDIAKIAEFMKGRYDSEGIAFVLGKKEKAA